MKYPVWTFLKNRYFVSHENGDWLEWWIPVKNPPIDFLIVQPLWALLLVL
jgi:hypothetical protein